MTGFPFDPHKGLIIVRAEVVGTSGARLALDTGATSTIANTAVLVAAGYDPALVAERDRVTTASGVEYAPRVSVIRLSALGVECKSFPVLAHTLPPGTTVDGLLGLDDFRGRSSGSISGPARSGWNNGHRVRGSIR